LYAQIHGYHWNVEVPNFRQLHATFEEQYQNLWAALDEIAERICSQGAYAPGSVVDLMALAAPEDTPAQSAHEMITKLIARHEALAASNNCGIEQCAAFCGGKVNDCLQVNHLIHQTHGSSGRRIPAR